MIAFKNNIRGARIFFGKSSQRDHFDITLGKSLGDTLLPAKTSKCCPLTTTFVRHRYIHNRSYKSGRRMLETPRCRRVIPQNKTAPSLFFNKKLPMDYLPRRCIQKCKSLLYTKNKHARKGNRYRRIFHRKPCNLALRILNKGNEIWDPWY